MKISRHLNYQNFEEKVYLKNNKINLDKLRFDWIKKIIGKNKIKNLTDIGSNLGYMCVNFNKYYNAKCIGYEYEKPTFFRANKIKKNLNNIKYINKGLNLKNLTKIKYSDLIIHLNVLHHAGHMYDKKIISDKKDWINYSIKYLKILNKKSKFLFFQTGNVNYNQNYFESKETYKVLPYILNKAGWKINKIGAINFSKKKLTYETYKMSEIKQIPNISCKRNKKGNKVFYYNKTKKIFTHEAGVLQRPLFWCISTK